MPLTTVVPVLRSRCDIAVHYIKKEDVDMVQDDNLSREMERYFAPLSSYKLGVEEQVELAWKPAGKWCPFRTEVFPSIEQGLARAASLALGHDVLLSIKPRQGDQGGRTGSRHLLALWQLLGPSTLRNLPDGFVELEGRPCDCVGAEARYYVGRGFTYFAARYHYPDRYREPNQPQDIGGPSLEEQLGGRGRP